MLMVWTLDMLLWRPVSVVDMTDECRLPSTPASRQVSRFAERTRPDAPSSDGIANNDNCMGCYDDIDKICSRQLLSVCVRFPGRRLWIS